MSDAALEGEERLLKIDVLIGGVECHESIQLKTVQEAE
ncbi:unnamed protein product [Echinostoma caproni]|uniref:Uncharacterized protein n=1 Tax=Echinostoma caproni TaxID=27848 RepID=A0A3P8IPU8_9TREM|nr:unnamed protein product [Echinostoma caproni]